MDDNLKPEFEEPEDSKEPGAVDPTPPAPALVNANDENDEPEGLKESDQHMTPNDSPTPALVTRTTKKDEESGRMTTDDDSGIDEQLASLIDSPMEVTDESVSMEMNDDPEKYPQQPIPQVGSSPIDGPGPLLRPAEEDGGEEEEEGHTEQVERVDDASAFAVKEEVMCQWDTTVPIFYKAKLMNQCVDENGKRGFWVHYCGWREGKYDHILYHNEVKDRLLKYTPELEEEHKELEKAYKAANSGKKRKLTNKQPSSTSAKRVVYPPGRKVVTLSNEYTKKYTTARCSTKRGVVPASSDQEVVSYAFAGKLHVGKGAVEKKVKAGVNGGEIHKHQSHAPTSLDEHTAYGRTTSTPFTGTRLDQSSTPVSLTLSGGKRRRGRPRKIEAIPAIDEDRKDKSMSTYLGPSGDKQGNAQPRKSAVTAGGTTGSLCTSNYFALSGGKGGRFRPRKIDSTIGDSNTKVGPPPHDHYRPSGSQIAPLADHFYARYVANASASDEPLPKRHRRTEERETLTCSRSVPHRVALAPSKSASSSGRDASFPPSAPRIFHPPPTTSNHREEQPKRFTSEAHFGKYTPIISTLLKQLEARTAQATAPASDSNNGQGRQKRFTPIVYAGQSTTMLPNDMNRPNTSGQATQNASPSISPIVKPTSTNNAPQVILNRNPMVWKAASQSAAKRRDQAIAKAIQNSRFLKEQGLQSTNAGGQLSSGSNLLPMSSALLSVTPAASGSGLVEPSQPTDAFSDDLDESNGLETNQSDHTDHELCHADPSVTGSSDSSAQLAKTPPIDAQNGSNGSRPTELVSVSPPSFTASTSSTSIAIERPSTSLQSPVLMALLDQPLENTPSDTDAQRSLTPPSSSSGASDDQETADNRPIPSPPHPAPSGSYSIDVLLSPAQLSSKGAVEAAPGSERGNGESPQSVGSSPPEPKHQQSAFTICSLLSLSNKPRDSAEGCPETAQRKEEGEELLSKSKEGAANASPTTVTLRESVDDGPGLSPSGDSQDGAGSSSHSPSISLELEMTDPASSGSNQRASDPPSSSRDGSTPDSPAHDLADAAAAATQQPQVVPAVVPPPAVANGVAQPVAVPAGHALVRVYSQDKAIHEALTAYLDQFDQFEDGAFKLPYFKAELYTKIAEQAKQHCVAWPPSADLDATPSLADEVAIPIRDRDVELHRKWHACVRGLDDQASNAAKKELLTECALLAEKCGGEMPAAFKFYLERARDRTRNV